MKKIFSLILVSAMLLGTVLMCGPAASAASVAKKPFYYSNWDSVDSDEFPNIWGKPYFWATRDGENVTVSYGGTTIKDIAKSLKKTFDKYPDNSGMRVINITPMERRFLTEMVTDHIYMSNGAKKAAQWMDEFLAEYKRIGGKLDGIASDLEYIHGLNWYLFSEAYNTGDTNVYYDIINNSEYKTRVRPQLEARGFKFYPSTAKNRTELYSLHPYAGAEYETSKLIWDTVMHNLWREDLETAFYEPLQKYYPDAMLWDYRSYDSYGWTKEIPETGRNQYLAGNTNKAGSHSSNNAYNYAPWTPWVVESASSTSYKKPVSYHDAICENNPFNMLMWETNSFKSMYAATDTHEIEVDLTHFNYTLMRDTVYKEGMTSSGTPYHVEGYFHAGLLDAEFGGYIILTEVGNASEYQYRMEVVQAIMDELNRLVGYADRKPIEVPVNWNDSFILSGMYANGRNVWRITPDTTNDITNKQFLVSSKGGKVVFYNEGQTITFPEGTIIKDGFIPAVGTCGYWVETPADVMPVITSDKDRYSQYPAFSESFDSYKSRDSFNTSKTTYSHTWELLKLEGVSATIKESQDGANDKVLAITGNAYLNNVNIPKNVTAGDNYAKQQAWEVTFSLSNLPEGDAEVNLLTAVSGSTTDDGFRVYKGKLYYSQAGKYQAFDSVSLAAGVEYRLKRTVDFRSFTGNYYVYDAEGLLLGKAENVPLTKLALPVEKIGFATEKFGSNTVFLDNYKIYADGITTDFELYDAATGIKMEDASDMMDVDAAYRLSWMNASGEAKAYNVVAAFSGGSKQVIETITMLPGCDGVNTGIVKVGNSAVMLSLEETEVDLPEEDETPDEEVDTSEPTDETETEEDPDYNYPDIYPEPSEDTTESTEDTTATEDTDKDTSKKKGGSSTALLIIIIILVTLSACALAAVLVMRNLPAKKTEETEAPEDSTEAPEDGSDAPGEEDISAAIAQAIEAAEADPADPSEGTDSPTQKLE